jgi:cell wall assembly regulator SMI1
MATARDFDLFLQGIGFFPPVSGVPAGISDPEIDDVAAQTGIRFVDDLRQLYLYSSEPFRGWTSKDGVEVPPIFPLYMRFMSWAEALGRWKYYLKSSPEVEKDWGENAQYYFRPAPEPHHAVLPGYAHPGWMPVAEDNTRVNMFVDHTPGPFGLVGQLVIYESSDDMGVRVASSLSGYFDQFMICVNRGQLRVDWDQQEWVSTTTAKRLAFVSSLDELL